LLEALCWLILICPCSICSTPRRLVQNISDSSPSFISFTASWNVRSPRLQSREFPMTSSHCYRLGFEGSCWKQMLQAQALSSFLQSWWCRLNCEVSLGGPVALEHIAFKDWSQLGLFSWSTCCLCSCRICSLIQ